MGLAASYSAKGEEGFDPAAPAANEVAERGGSCVSTACGHCDRGEQSEARASVRASPNRSYLRPGRPRMPGGPPSVCAGRDTYGASRDAVPGIGRARRGTGGGEPASPADRPAVGHRWRLRAAAGEAMGARRPILFSPSEDRPPCAIAPSTTGRTVTDDQPRTDPATTRNRHLHAKPSAADPRHVAQSRFIGHPFATPSDC